MKRITLLTSALFFYLFILQLQAIWPFTVDDMYISLRYALHWAMGDGLLWNLNEPPVEGYSNFSFVVLGALALLLKLDPVLVLKIAGILGLFFTCFFIYAISRFWFNTRISLLASLSILVYKGQIIWAVSGLETTLYQACLCAAVFFCFRGMGYVFYNTCRLGLDPTNLSKREYQHFSLIICAVCLFLAGITRPEAPLFMVVFFILIAWDSLVKKRNFNFQSLLGFVLPLILFYLPYFLWRWHYYGLIVPNPVYCKGLSNYFLILDKQYLQLCWPLLLVSSFACFKSWDIRYCFLLAPTVVYLILLSGSDPVVAFDNRLFLPALVLLFPLALKGISDLLKQKNIHNDLYLSLTFTLFIVLFIPGLSLANYKQFSQNPVAGERLRQQVIHWLDTHSRPDDSIVLGDSGMIPFYVKARFIDSYCLNNKIMGQYSKKERYERFCKKVLFDKPNLIILTSLIKGGKIIYTPSDSCLKSLLKDQDTYTLAKKTEAISPDSTYRYELFVKKQL